MQATTRTGWAKARIQLCGRFVVDIDGSRIEDTLPGRRGRVLFAYLVLNRGRPLPRDELLVAGWGEDTPAAARNALSVLLSKLRHGLGANRLRGRTEIELLMPRATFVEESFLTVEIPPCDGVIAVGEPVPDVRVWRSTSEAVHLRELGGESGSLLLFYLFDWSST